MTRFFGGAGAAAVAWAALLLTSCTNHNFQGMERKPSASDEDAGAFSTLPTVANSSLVALNRVVRNSNNPQTEFDLIGDGSGSMGQYCVAGQDGKGSTCACSYEYIKSDGGAERFDAETVYNESNLLRCRMTGIPLGISYVKVRVHLTFSDTYSNEFVFRYANSPYGLDLSSPASFSRIRRYQCKDSVIVPYLMDPDHVYDPILSEDPEYSYPLNFYTHNIGGIYAFFAGSSTASGGAGWVCPPMPNDSTENLEMTVYSQAADGSNSRRIYPPAGSAHDRSTFYLARQPAGVFSMPVNAMAAPDIRTSATGSTGGLNDIALPPPLGYGVAPVPAGSDQEVCPDSSTVKPPGFKWVKVWLFRASLEARKVKTSTPLRALQSISCNPGKWQTLVPGSDPNKQQIIADCGDDGGSVATNGGTIADRVLAIGNGICIKLGSIPASETLITNACPSTGGRRGGIGCTTDSSGDRQKTVAGDTTSTALFSRFRLGTDVWYRPEFAATCGTTPDGINLCEPMPVPYAEANEVRPLDVASRRDYLFVVTPEEVMTQDFKNGTPRSLQYTPFRFYSPNDCRSGDPGNAPAGDCPAHRRITYGFTFHDVNSNGDAPEGTLDRLPSFPVCALQPDS